MSSSSYLVDNTLFCYYSLVTGEGMSYFCGGIASSVIGFFFVMIYIILLTRIEPVGKPYREVCLHSELWPWMTHQPNSWSKHPGTRIEQVLAYCRQEQKYVGCIELLFCLTVTMTFGVQT